MITNNATLVSVIFSHCIEQKTSMWTNADILFVLFYWDLWHIGTECYWKMTITNRKPTQKFIKRNIIWTNWVIQGVSCIVVVGKSP